MLQLHIIIRNHILNFLSFYEVSLATILDCFAVAFQSEFSFFNFPYISNN